LVARDLESDCLGERCLPTVAGYELPRANQHRRGDMQNVQRACPYGRGMLSGKDLGSSARPTVASSSSLQKTLRCQAVTSSTRCKCVSTVGGAKRARMRSAAELSGSGKYHFVMMPESK